MTYRVPFALASCAVVGLVLALAADGLGDVLGVALTAVPAVVLTHALVRALRAPVTTTTSPRAARRRSRRI